MPKQNKEKNQEKNKTENDKTVNEKEEKKIKALKERYENLRKKYSLPSFDELNKEFEIEQLIKHKTMFLLKFIRRCIYDKFSFFAGVFDSLLSGLRVSGMMALKKISDEEKRKIYDFIEKVSRIRFESLKLELEYDEKNEAEMIKRLYDEWKKMKPEILAILNACIAERKSQELKYLG
ncbi:MAG: hypothetical protein QXE64_00695 [Candidatus Pacearchaeota archaeon]